TESCRSGPPWTGQTGTGNGPCALRMSRKRSSRSAAITMISLVIDEDRSRLRAVWISSGTPATARKGLGRRVPIRSPLPAATMTALTRGEEGEVGEGMGGDFLAPVI